MQNWNKKGQQGAAQFIVQRFHSNDFWELNIYSQYVLQPMSNVSLCQCGLDVCSQQDFGWTMSPADPYLESGRASSQRIGVSEI